MGTYLSDPPCSPSAELGLLRLCQTVTQKESLLRLAASVVALTRHLNAWFGDEACAADPLALQNAANVLQCALLAWRRRHDNGACSALEDALCVALLIFTVRASEALQLHERTRHHHLNLVASKALRRTLVHSPAPAAHRSGDPGPSHDDSHDEAAAAARAQLSVWIAAVGAISAHTSADEAWFVAHAAHAFARAGVRSLPDLVARLHRCAWVGFVLDGAARALWGAVSTVQSSAPSPAASAPRLAVYRPSDARASSR